jgi:glyceraldehyde-3-phosphate dehydrogenase (NADP+)
MPRHQRAALLAQVAAALASQKPELSRLMATEAGKPLQFAAGEVDRAVATFTVAAEEAKRLSGEWLPTDWTPAGEGYLAMTKRVPLGPIAAFAPFNFPLNLVAHKIAPCLASGNTMVLKPPPQAPLTSLRLGRILVDAGMPPGWSISSRARCPSPRRSWPTRGSGSSRSPAARRSAGNPKPAPAKRACS